MKLSDFLSAKPVQRADLFGPWHQKKVHLDQDEAAALSTITLKLAWIRNKFKQNLDSLALPADAEVQFKRAPVNGNGDGEWVLVLSNGNPIKCYTASAAGFQEAPLAPAAPTSETPDTPLELRRGWINYELLNAINEAYANGETDIDTKALAEELIRRQKAA